MRGRKKGGNGGLLYLDPGSWSSGHMLTGLQVFVTICQLLQVHAKQVTTRTERTTPGPTNEWKVLPKSPQKENRWARPSVMCVISYKYSQSVHRPIGIIQMTSINAGVGSLSLFFRFSTPRSKVCSIYMYMYINPLEDSTELSFLSPFQSHQLFRFLNLLTTICLVPLMGVIDHPSLFFKHVGHCLLGDTPHNNCTSLTTIKPCLELQGVPRVEWPKHCMLAIFDTTPYLLHLF